MTEITNRDVMNKVLPKLFTNTIDIIEDIFKKPGPKPTDEDIEIAAEIAFWEVYGKQYQNLERRLKLAVEYAKARDLEWTLSPSKSESKIFIDQNRHPISRKRQLVEDEGDAPRLFRIIKKNAGGIGLKADIYTIEPTEEQIEKKPSDEREAIIKRLMSEYGVSKSDAHRQPWSAVFISACMRRLKGKESDQIIKQDGFLSSGAHWKYFHHGYENARAKDLSRPFWTSGISEIPISVGDLISKTWSTKNDRKVFSDNGGHLGHWRKIRDVWDANIDHGAAIEKWTRHTHSDLVIYVGPLAADEISEPKGNFAVTLGGNTRDVRTTDANTVGMKIYELSDRGEIVREVEKNLDDTVKTNTAYAVLHRPTREQRIKTMKKTHSEMIEKIAKENRLKLTIDSFNSIETEPLPIPGLNPDPIEGDFPETDPIPTG